ncbi:recombinase family protein [Singulisphaera sp. PoT]|uniref:recombinase family protein n=1 Tax=Singulisphaera sp. PoT TaxID=3411797 RepID=UPI003BF58131
MKDAFGNRATKAIALARVSTPDQEQGYSLDAQTFRLREYCMRNDLEVIRTFEIVESSTVGTRKDFMAAIDFARRQKERIAIITDKVDRLQRRLTETPLLEKLIGEGKIELHFHVENVQIHKDSTSQERLMWNLHVILAQSYVDSLRDNVNRSIQQKLRKGEWISHAPIGYLHIRGLERERGTGRIVVDPVRAPLVQKLFSCYASGEYTLGDLTRKAKEWGLRNSVRSQGTLSQSHIHRLLQNPFYHGVMRVQKTGKEYPHIYQPLVSREVFEACQAVRLGWKKKPYKYGGQEYVFRGLITCAITGRVVTADTKRRERAGGTPYQIIYLGTYNPADTTRKIWVREDEVLARVEEVFRNLKLAPEDVAEIVQYIRSGAAYERDYHKAHLESLHREQTAIKSKLDRLMDFWLDAKITEEDHAEFRKALAVRRDEITLEITQHNSADDKFAERMQDIVKISGNAQSHFRLSNVEGKRRLVNLVFSTLKLRGKNLEYTIRSPFDHFIKADEMAKWRSLIDDFRRNPSHRDTIAKFPSYFLGRDD